MERAQWRPPLQRRPRALPPAVPPHDEHPDVVVPPLLAKLLKRHLAGAWRAGAGQLGAVGARGRGAGDGVGAKEGVQWPCLVLRRGARGAPAALLGASAHSPPLTPPPPPRAAPAAR
jgi:hypothetical protein